MADWQKKAVGYTDQVIKSCLLCRRDFCARHRSETEDVCQINHETYYAKHRLSVERIYPSLEDRREALEKAKAAEASAASKDRGAEASGTSKGDTGASGVACGGQGGT